MTPEEFTKLQRDFLIRTDKRSAVLIFREFQKMKTEISAFLLKHPDSVNRSMLDKLLALLAGKVDILSSSSALIVENAQKSVIGFAAEKIKTFLPDISSTIFRTDAPAIKKLIGRTQSGQTLSKFLKRLNPLLRELAAATLTDGFALGEPAAQIAKRIRQVSDIGTRRALTIARTETNEAYRAATREFYEEAGIKEYIWMSILDRRTCIICWYLHGQKFKTSVKAFSHPNCRCCLVPVIKGQPPVETGIMKFEKIGENYQKQILGAKRFELFENGNSLDSFVRSECSREFGEKFFVKNLV